MAIELVDLAKLGAAVAIPICPHCETENPPYGFRMNRADLGVMGTAEYLTIYCAAQKPPIIEGAEPAPPCRKILSVFVLSLVPPQDPAMLAELARRVRGEKH
jgi:hypothetical protein